MSAGRRRRRFWQRRRTRRSFRLTREGKAFVLVTLGVGVAAVNTGNNLLYLVLGLMLSLLLVSGVLSDLALIGLHARRILPRRIFAQTLCRVEVVLRNKKRFFPSFSLEVEDVVDGEDTPTRSYFLKVPPRGEDRVFYPHLAARRGRRRFTHLRLVTRYPFGLIEKGRVIPAEEEVIVFPHIEPRSPPRPTRQAKMGEDATCVRGPGSELAGLRDYAPEDEARDIHWRRTASLGSVVVRERERERGVEHWLVLDEATAEPDDPAFVEAFELAVSELASLATASLAAGYAVRVASRTLTSRRFTPERSPDALYRLLALLEPRALEGAPALVAPHDARVVRVAAQIEAAE
ncbi:MAG: DUF58 domain-containing protein [Deltaproteobacteria bacterium]|nr:DUF58 domain-containing protein [Deltaproteobacteria bacterium]